MTLYILIYLNSTVRERNQSDDDYVKPKQKKQKLEDGEYMLYVALAHLWDRNVACADNHKDVLKCPNTTITILTLVFESTGTVVSHKYTPPCT